MKNLTWFAGALAAVLLACAPAMAQDNAEPKPKPDKAKTSGLKGEYAIMASVLGMDDAQKAKFAEAVEANRADERRWKEGDGKKAEELSKAAAEARKAGDKEKVKKIEEDMQAVKESRRKLEEGGKARIMAVLTDEQKTRYAAFNLERQVLRRLSFRNIELTDDQKKQIKDLCTEAVKSRPAGEDAKAAALADKKLLSEIEQKVLTDA